MPSEYFYAKLAKYAYLDHEEFVKQANTLFTNITEIKFIEGATYDTQAYIVNVPHRTYFIFRGTDSMTDVFIDLDVRKSKIFADSDAEVHTGFKKQYDEIKHQVFDYVDKHCDNKNVYCIGHSLGSAAAAIFAIKIQRKFENNIRCITYGSPRVGDDEFARIFNESPVVCTRVVNKNDPITMVPSKFRFKHVGEKMHIKKRKKTLFKRFVNFWMRGEDKFSFLKCMRGAVMWIPNKLFGIANHKMDAYVKALAMVNFTEGDDQKRSLTPDLIKTGGENDDINHDAAESDGGIDTFSDVELTEDY